MESCTWTDRMCQHRRASSSSSSNFDVASRGSQNFTVFVLGKVNGDIGSFHHSHYQSSRLCQTLLLQFTAGRDNSQAATVCYSRTKQMFALLLEPLHVQDHPGIINAHTPNSDMAVTVKWRAPRSKKATFWNVFELHSQKTICQWAHFPKQGVRNTRVTFQKLTATLSTFPPCARAQDVWEPSKAHHTSPNKNKSTYTEFCAVWLMSSSHQQRSAQTSSASVSLVKYKDEWRR